MKKRASGILLHISSLPSRFGVGDFGPEAYKFADFLVRAKQSYWQVLPLNPPIPIGNNYSPYNSSSAFAGNTLFISPEYLYKQGFLAKKDIQSNSAFCQANVNYRSVYSYKKKLFDTACECFEKYRKRTDYKRFCVDNVSWLEDHATFTALCQYFHNRSWDRWPIELREHRKASVQSAKTRLAREVNREKFVQYVFFRQWYDFKKYCNERNIRIIGDIPFYVAYQSADVWANPEVFKLTKTKKPRFIAGVPPDFFSRNGQLWNNPVYNWQALKKTGYKWWLRKVKHNLDLFDIVRLDHFRGFAAFWQVPAGSKTAKNGKWIPGPKEDFLNKLFKRFSLSRFIAEDLGYITTEVRELIKQYQLSCMKILIFGFDGDMSKNLHCPYNYISNSVVYTGTHDNNTVRGWLEKEAGIEQRKRLFDYIGHKVPDKRIHWELIRLAMSSVSNTVIVPMQDVLRLSEEARMNRPASLKGNWTWRLQKKDLKLPVAKSLAKMTEIYGRI